MPIAALLAWSSAIPQLISAGVLVEGQVAGVLKSFHASMTDEQLNAVAALILTGAVKGQAVAKKDMGDMIAPAPVA